ncbi:MAG TPA: M14 family metallopeptidase [Candidatus Acidoferrales bacterium]|jgi:predicted deacylase|nr:M14 family metallopeptidase [Candidatus Acidoferrales bacterium]
MADAIESRTIEILAGADAGTEIPVTTFRGAHPGPVLALIAGNHGYEYPPILALQQLRGQIQPALLHGTVIMVHVANMPSFLGRTIYFSPVDGKNLNRCYPGNPDGTVSERIAHAITTQVIEPADYVLDLHCGDGNESLRPYVYQTVTGDARLDAAIGELALAFGIGYILVDRNRPTDAARSIYCSTTAITRGKPAMTIECGYLGMSDSVSIQQIVSGVRGVMRHLKMLEDGPAPIANAVYLDPFVDILSPATGILYPEVERAQVISKGKLLARITDFFGNPIATVESPIAGRVLYIVATPPITTGQPIACVAAPRVTGTPRPTGTPRANQTYLAPRD